MIQLSGESQDHGEDHIVAAQDFFHLPPDYYGNHDGGQIYMQLQFLNAVVGVLGIISSIFMCLVGVKIWHSQV